MSVITVKRTIRPSSIRRADPRPSIRELSRAYFTHERPWQFVLEVILFAAIVAISAWPLLAAAEALNNFLQHTAV